MFVLIFSIILAERLIELLVAKRNEKKMLRSGGYEVGRGHYRYMVLLHSCFLGSLILEVVGYGAKPPQWTWVLLGLFFTLQAGRIWCISSLGVYWNTKIMILPGAHVIEKGPYRWLRHPNYVIVSLEIVCIPLIFGAYVTALVFSVLNMIILFIRIPMEEKALQQATDYTVCFQEKKRFVPKVKT
ncbi:isoprenylcysteine carboxyl methyltransferase [Fictibacillus macauensis ZFHKF-1]|uniref:Isoprenylcysteine carboxyl methyltransferase n=1 Tax=Fictibacillus macauensis ZFHKF-1 TaxID=1196324 RepID=I8UI08_9BACL|nr:isoprenylcysteine carboxylmethyltransferase family protein [Fictibacillus macauensis]EIT86515.1 isoprenylcysteine carboxyl methyltransferase [Fictibacillus macauensis ZFHKF-1]